jgi:hypothetical protein
MERKWNISRIAGVKKLSGSVYYKISWEGYSHEHDSWELTEKIEKDFGKDDVRSLLEKYEQDAGEGGSAGGSSGKKYPSSLYFFPWDPEEEDGVAVETDEEEGMAAEREEEEGMAMETDEEEGMAAEREEEQEMTVERKVEKPKGRGMGFLQALAQVQQDNDRKEGMEVEREDEQETEVKAAERGEISAVEEKCAEGGVAGVGTPRVSRGLGFKTALVLELKTWPRSEQIAAGMTVEKDEDEKTAERCEIRSVVGWRKNRGVGFTTAVAKEEETL